MPDKIKILVVDDEEVMRALFTRTLGLKGYKVTTAKDGPSPSFRKIGAQNV